MTSSEPPLFAALRRRRFFRSLGAVLVVMACVIAAVQLSEIDGWPFVEVVAVVAVLVVLLAIGFAGRREAAALALVRAAKPDAWTSAAAVHGLALHVVVAVDRDEVSVIGYDGVPVAIWERSEMAAVDLVTLPSHWPARPALLIQFFSPQTPAVLVTFTAMIGLAAPPERAAEAARVLAPSLY